MTETMASHADSVIVSHTRSNPWRQLRNRLMLRRKTRDAFGLGLLSATLYYGLYYFNDEIRALTEAANHGDKTYFLLPIGLAFLFSLVHGLFTDRFWEALGLKAKR